MKLQLKQRTNQIVKHKMKKGILLTAFALITSSAFSQKADLTSAILSYRKQDISSAKNYIDQAQQKLNEGGTLKAKDLSKFWHNKGLIYQAQYEASKDLTELDVAIEAFTKDTETEGSSFAKKSKDQLLTCAFKLNNAAFDMYDAKDFESALVLFEKVVSVNSLDIIGKVDTSNLYNAALMSEQAKNSDKIIELYSRLADLDSSNGDYHLSLIKEYNRQGDTENTLAAINRGRAQAPNHTGIIFEEVNYYLAQNDNQALLSSLETAINAAPDNKILHFAKGMTLANLSKIDEAKAAYLDAINIDNDYFDAYNNLANLYLEQTVELVEKMNSLGLSQADQKKYANLKSQRNALYAEAKPFLEEAVRIDASSIEVLNALKEVCYQTDDIECWKATSSKIKELNK